MKPTVLIIEDEPNIAEAEKLVLEDHYQVHIASDGEEGLAKAKILIPDLIVLDLMLPKRGGYDVCFHLRQDDKLKGIKVLMLTAKAQEIDQDKGILVGTDLYMTKPFEADELLTNVRSLLKASKSL